MPIFFKISFVSQSTQNLFAALRLLNVNPASTAASLFVESNKAIISDTHSLFCHILCAFLLYSVAIASSPRALEGNPKFKANQGTLFQGRLQNRSHLMQP